jgi:hypothetical protein
MHVPELGTHQTTNIQLCVCNQRNQQLAPLNQKQDFISTKIKRYTGLAIQHTETVHIHLNTIT